MRTLRNYWVARGVWAAAALALVVGVALLLAAARGAIAARESHGPVRQRGVARAIAAWRRAGTLLKKYRPLVIRRGGTYRGIFASGNPAVPAVSIRTRQPVTIADSTIAGRGNLIVAAVPGCHVVVRNCRGYGLNPNVRGRVPGRFFSGESCASVVLKNNTLAHTAGIYLLNFQGGPAAPAPTLEVLRNDAIDIDGRKSNGHGGFLPFDIRVRMVHGKAVPQRGFRNRQFLQLDKVRHVPHVNIAWNQVINQPGHSRVEDNISIYKSSGTRASPIRIHDNYIQGAYNIRPWMPAKLGKKRRDGWRYKWPYTGGGIMLGDGKTRRPATAPAYVIAYHNQIVSTTNYGIAISAGHDLTMRNNRIISCGHLPKGKKIADQNVGAYVWDEQHERALHPPVFYNNSGSGNLIGWQKAHGRNDWWTPGTTKWKHNRHWPGPLTLRTEAAERRRWRRKLKKRHVLVGVAGG